MKTSRAIERFFCTSRCLTKTLIKHQVFVLLRMGFVYYLKGTISGAWKSKSLIKERVVVEKSM